MSQANLEAEAAMPQSTWPMRSSSLRVAVWPETGMAGKPTLAQKRCSSASTLSPSPSKSSRKLAWVPVVPLMPRTGVVRTR